MLLGVGLSACIASQFPKPATSAATNKRFMPRFTAAYMSRTRGLQIQWTACLADHLRVDPMSRTVRIYHFKRCLSDQQANRGSINGKAGSILPTELLQETVWTLNLLFPANDEQTITFLKKCHPSKTFCFDTCVDDRRPLELDTYCYWRQRLEDVLEIYDQGPSTLRQYISYQKPQERINLIVVVLLGFILALTFGLISSITAIISTRATLQALEVARETYLLQAMVPICPCS